ERPRRGRRRALGAARPVPAARPLASLGVRRNGSPPRACPLGTAATASKRHQRVCAVPSAPRTSRVAGTGGPVVGVPAVRSPVGPASVQRTRHASLVATGKPHLHVPHAPFWRSGPQHDTIVQPLLCAVVVPVRPTYKSGITQKVNLNRSVDLSK